MSHRGDLTARMVELPLLLAERPFTQAELAQHFGVDRKTVKRAIDAVSLHYPVEELSDGREARYCFSDGYRFTPPTLTPSELATLVLSQEAIAATQAPGSPFAEHARRLLMKVKNSLPPKLRDKLDALATVYGSAVVPAKDFTAHAATIDRLTDAAILRHKLRLTYHSLTDGQIKERVVEPYCVYFDPDGATLKLIGYDYTRRDITTFSVDRIRKLEPTGEDFMRPPDFELREYLAENCFNGIHGAPVNVTLRAYNKTAQIFHERTFHQSQRIVEHTIDGDEATTTITMRVASGRGLVRFILSWAPDVEVLEPRELREEVADVQRRALERSGKSKLNAPPPASRA